MYINYLAGRSHQTVQMPAIIHVRGRRPGGHRLPCSSSSERIATMLGYARIAVGIDLRFGEANQQERASAETRSPGIHSKIAKKERKCASFFLFLSVFISIGKFLTVYLIILN